MLTLLAGLYTRSLESPTYVADYNSHIQAWASAGEGKRGLLDFENDDVICSFPVKNTQIFRSRLWRSH